MERHRYEDIPIYRCTDRERERRERISVRCAYGGRACVGRIYTCMERGSTGMVKSSQMFDKRNMTVDYRDSAFPFFFLSLFLSVSLSSPPVIVHFRRLFR